MSDFKPFFTPQQRATIEAAMARIIPSGDSPGAKEAGTVDFVDRYLSGIDYIYAKPDGSGFETLVGIPAVSWTKRIAVLQQTYLAGIDLLESKSQSKHQSGFADLTAEQQDAILTDIERPDGEDGSDEAPALQQTNAEIDLKFFPLLCLHTRQGFYADPIYGGNQNRIGWDHIGFPGPRSLKDVHTGGSFTALPWFAEGHNK